VNGKILDLAMFDAGQELAADLPLRLARSGADALRNAEVLAVLESYFAVIELRNSVQLLSRNIETSAERVEQLRIRQRQGTVTRRQVWDKEIELDKLREARLEAEYGLLAAEYSLQAGIGNDVDVSDLTLSDRLPTVASPPPVGESLERAYEQNVSVSRAREQIRQAQLQTIVNGRRYAANLSASVQLAPNPSPLYEGAADIGSSYEELFSDESKWQPTVSLGLSVPLYTGGRARLQRRQDEAAERRAQLALQDSQHQLEQSVEALYLRRRLLEDQRALRESALTLERERLSETKTLASLQTVTDLDIREAEAQVLARENDLWRTRADLTLNALRIQQVSGNDLPSVLGVED
jgi:outer membrane protein